MRIDEQLAAAIAHAAISQPYRQLEVLSTREFANWLKERTLDIPWQQIHHLWAIGAIRPVAVLEPALAAVTERDSRFLPIDIGYEVPGYIDLGTVPEGHSSLVGGDDPPREWGDAVLWHPFQLWDLTRVYPDWNGEHVLLDTLKRARIGHLRRRRILADYRTWATDISMLLDEASSLPILALLLAAEPLVHDQLDTRIATHPLAGETPDGYYAWRDAIDGTALLQAFGLTINEVIDWHGKFAREAHFRDPMRELRTVLRHASHVKRDLLRDDALLAHNLYDAAEVLRRYLETYHADDLVALGIDIREEHDILVLMTRSEIRAFNERHYGSARLTDADRSVVRRILREFDLDPQPRLTWFVEGDTEEAFLRHFADSEHTPLSMVGIEVMNLKGLGGLDGARVRTLLERYQREETFVYVTTDRDARGDHIRQLRQFRQHDLLPSGWHLFDPDFEEANFTLAELVEVANGIALADGHILGLTMDEVHERVVSTGEPVGKAIERVTRQKHWPIEKNAQWGRALAEWALAHPCPAGVADIHGERPVVFLLHDQRSAQTSSYHWTVRLYAVDDDGTLTRREREEHA